MNLGTLFLISIENVVKGGVKREFLNYGNCFLLEIGLLYNLFLSFLTKTGPYAMLLAVLLPIVGSIVLD
jgi:hypothetical protein